MDEAAQTTVQVPEASFDIIFQQFETLSIYLARPDVQQQILAILLTILFGWIVATFGSRWVRRGLKRTFAHLPEDERDERIERWQPVFTQFLFPLAGLIVVFFLLQIYQAQGLVAGLLLDANFVFIALLVYEIIITLLYARFNVTIVRPYHRYILNPIFALVIFLQVNILDLSQLGELPIITVLEADIRLGSLVQGGLILYGFIVASWIAHSVIEVSLSRNDSIERSLTNSISTVIRYLLLLLGFVAALSALGFNIATLIAIAGGLSVGISLGLQKIAANFASGLVLLLEQRLAPGDVITIEGNTGIVQSINIRATTLRTFSNEEILVPNENLLNFAVTNMSNTQNPEKRITIELLLRYDTDHTFTRDLIMETITRHGKVVKTPEPGVFLTEMSVSKGAKYLVLAWVANFDDRFGTQSDLFFMLLQAFKKNGIRLADEFQDVQFVNPLEMHDSAESEDETPPNQSLPGHSPTTQREQPHGTPADT